MDAGVSDDHADGALTLQPHVTIRPRRQNNLQLATLLKRIDAQPIKDHDLLVKRRLSFLLLLGALLGLMAQEAAFASAPAMPTHDISMAASAMSDECAEMMGIDKSEGEAPCKGLTLDCIAKMGCALPLAVATPATVLAASDHSAAPADQLPVSRLRGRTFGREPDPPLFLG